MRIGVEVAQTDVEQAAVIDNLRAAAGELDQRLGMHRVHILPVVDVPCFRVAVIVADFVRAAEHFGILLFEDAPRIVGVTSVEIAVPWTKMEVVALAAARHNL